MKIKVKKKKVKRMDKDGGYLLDCASYCSYDINKQGFIGPKRDQILHWKKWWCFTGLYDIWFKIYTPFKLFALTHASENDFILLFMQM